MEVNTLLIMVVVSSFIMLSIALYFDLRYQRIPNKLCFVALLLGSIINTIFNESGLGAALTLVILLLAYRLHLLGAD